MTGYSTQKKNSQTECAFATSSSFSLFFCSLNLPPGDVHSHHLFPDPAGKGATNSSGSVVRLKPIRLKSLKFRIQPPNYPQIISMCLYIINKYIYIICDYVCVRVYIYLLYTYISKTLVMALAAAEHNFTALFK